MYALIALKFLTSEREKNKQVEKERVMEIQECGNASRDTRSYTISHHSSQLQPIAHKCFITVRNLTWWVPTKREQCKSTKSP